MADILSQNDLDALWASDSNGEAKTADADSDSTDGAGISQSDLDALFGLLEGGGESGRAAQKNATSSNGLSQTDLDALWGGLANATERTEPTVIIQPAPAGAVNENLSQDDIDRLLAEMGK
jgi:hypothetical protein